MVKKVRLVAVRSTSIAYIGYDERRQRILVQYKKGGGWYAYPAPLRLYLQAIVAARRGSIGKWVNATLINMPGQVAIRLSVTGKEEVVRHAETENK